MYPNSGLSYVHPSKIIGKKTKLAELAIEMPRPTGSTLFRPISSVFCSVTSYPRLQFVYSLGTSKYGANKIRAIKYMVPVGVRQQPFLSLYPITLNVPPIISNIRVNAGKTATVKEARQAVGYLI